MCLLCLICMPLIIKHKWEKKFFSRQLYLSNYLPNTNEGWGRVEYSKKRQKSGVEPMDICQAQGWVGTNSLHCLSPVASEVCLCLFPSASLKPSQAVSPSSFLAWKLELSSACSKLPWCLEVAKGIRLSQLGNFIPHFSAAGKGWPILFKEGLALFEPLVICI